jgi:hypothetical protein
MSVSRLFIGLLAAAMLAVSATTPALAYGKENWQIGFAGTGIDTTSQQGFGFWGWCTFGGGVNSGNEGDCQFAQYFHSTSGGRFTCQESLEITSWTRSSPTGDFLISGTATVHPSDATAPCLLTFPGSATFSGVDSGIPAAPGHYNLGGLGPGLRGEFQIQVTQIP